MLICAVALALTGVVLMAVVAAIARRGGYRASTVFSRRRAARLARLAARPVATADQRLSTTSPMRRRVRRLRRRRVVAPLSHATVSAPVRRVNIDALDRAVAVTAESAGAQAPLRARRSTAEERAARVADAQAAAVERIVMGFDGVEADPDMLAALRRRVEIVPEVIEADPIDADVINPARLTRTR